MPIDLTETVHRCVWRLAVLQEVASGSVSSTSFLSCDLLIRFPPTVFSGLVMVPSPAIAQSPPRKIKSHYSSSGALPCAISCQCAIIPIYLFFPSFCLFFFKDEEDQKNDGFQVCVRSMCFVSSLRTSCKEMAKVAGGSRPLSILFLFARLGGELLPPADCQSDCTELFMHTC